MAEQEIVPPGTKSIYGAPIGEVEIQLRVKCRLLARPSFAPPLPTAPDF